MATPNTHLGESFLDRLIKDTYNKNSLGDLSTEQMNELDAYMKSDDFKTKSQNFRSTDRTKFEGSVDNFLGKDTDKSKTYLQSQTNPDTTKYLIPRLTTNSTQTGSTTTQTSTNTTETNKPATTKTTAKPLTTTSVNDAVVTTTANPVSFNFVKFTNENLTQGEKTSSGRKYARIDPAGKGDFWVRDDGKIFIRPVGGGVGQEITSRPNWGGDSYDTLMKLLKKYYKQGGTMNRIKYFEKGGLTPQNTQDIQQQVVALVQAAMQGDEKANQTVTQIMEAAKAGDQKAAQLAQMIQQVVQQMQGQATTAKWGAKLGYIRSLKYAQGGKACPACEKGAPIKVEEKACGGKAKKAKKRYFGGWL